MTATPEIMIFFRILAAHILADFFMQRYTWIVEKQNGPASPYLYYHVLIVGGLTYLFLADWNQWQLPLFIMITHFFIDWWKSTKNDKTRYFVIDQLLHILMLIIGWLWYTETGIESIAAYLPGVTGSDFWVILTGYLLILRPAGFLIGKMVARWNTEIPSNGLNNAGTWIGYLERFIILTFILVGQYSAIGFLIAAKSIFRYAGTAGDTHDRKYIEYILIGTLLSFTAAILTGITARALLFS